MFNISFDLNYFVEFFRLCWVSFLNPTYELVEENINSVIPNTSIWHNSVTESSSNQARTFQIGSGQVSFPENTSTQISSTQISPGQISSIETSVMETSSSKVGISKISTNKLSAGQSSTSEIDSRQISTIKTALSQLGINKTGIFQNSTSQIKFVHPITLKANTTQVDSKQIRVQLNSREIALPLSIPFQQFISFHNLTPALNNINNSNLLPIWNSLTNPENPFNLTLEITDLPTGQLTEAQVTEFTDQGIPNGGTILIDHNANGLGWFIDTTPLDHSEFSQTLTNTALLVRRLG